jgi:hypothetical protein
VTLPIIWGSIYGKREVAMKIDFTKKQYESLLKVVYMGNEMVNSILDDSEENEFDEIEQYIFSFAKDFGLEASVEYDEKEETYYPSQQLEEDKAVVEYTHRYDDYTFWDKLIYNLARRDMVKECGEEKVAKMSNEETFVKEQSFAEKYEKEFTDYGLRNLIVKHPSERKK